MLVYTKFKNWKIVKYYKTKNILIVLITMTSMEKNVILVDERQDMHEAKKINSE